MSAVEYNIKGCSHIILVHKGLAATRRTASGVLFRLIPADTAVKVFH